jgi:hypothetical protein
MQWTKPTSGLQDEQLEATHFRVVTLCMETNARHGEDDYKRLG